MYSYGVVYNTNNVNSGLHRDVISYITSITVFVCSHYNYLYYYYCKYNKVDAYIDVYIYYITL